MLATVPRNASIPGPTHLQRSGSTYNSMQEINLRVLEVALTAEQKVPDLYQDYVLVGCDVVYFGRQITFWSRLPSDPKRTVIFALITVRTSNLTGILLFWISQEWS
jgi:hypothetical protein